MSQSKPYSAVPAGAAQQPTPFELHIEQQAIDDFKTLLRLSPIAKETYENTNGNGAKRYEDSFGVMRNWIVNAKQVWLEEFDWRAQESHINSFPNFKTNVQDDDGHKFDIHFAALFSKKKDAIPLVFLHGWPGSFLEFLPIMEILRKKYSPEDLPYHIIAPSLPGYTLSSPPPLDRDWGVEDTARIMHKLLLSLGLGESGYIVQGGDIGSMVARTMAVNYTECKGAHLNFVFMVNPPEGISATDTSLQTPQEQEGLKRAAQFGATGNAYGRMHGTRPSTIGLVLSSSPLALLSWIAEKFNEWTDTDLPLTTILTDVSLYWFSNCFPSSIYTYRQDFTSRSPQYFHAQPHLHIKKPFGYSYFPKELMPIPRKWAERTGQLVSFKAHESGGHFAALEKPEELWEDVEEFVKVAWKV